MTSRRLILFASILSLALLASLYLDIRGRYAPTQLELDGHAITLALISREAEFILNFTHGTYRPDYQNDPRTTAFELSLNEFSDFLEPALSYLGPLGYGHFESPSPIWYVSILPYELTHRTTLSLPTWIIHTLLALPIPFLLLRAYRRRIRPGQCSRCNYDLRASPTTCPECGQSVHSKPRSLFSSIRRRAWQLTVLLSTLLAIPFTLATFQSFQLPRQLSFQKRNQHAFILWDGRINYSFTPNTPGQLNFAFPGEPEITEHHLNPLPNKRAPFDGDFLHLPTPNPWFTARTGPLFSPRKIPFALDITLRSKSSDDEELQERFRLPPPNLSLPAWPFIPLLLLPLLLSLVARFTQRKSLLGLSRLRPTARADRDFGG